MVTDAIPTTPAHMAWPLYSLLPLRVKAAIQQSVKGDNQSGIELGASAYHNRQQPTRSATRLQQSTPPRLLRVAQLLLCRASLL